MQDMTEGPIPGHIMRMAYASVATATIQAAVIWWMLSVEMKRRLGDEPSVIMAPSPG